MDDGAMMTRGRAAGAPMPLRRRTLLKAGAAAAVLASMPRTVAFAAGGLGYKDTGWGCTNTDMPDGSDGDDPFYIDASGNYPNLDRYWLPQPPSDAMPGMLTVWLTLGQATGGGTLGYYTVLQDDNSPFKPRPPFLVTQEPPPPSPPLPALSRVSRSPNWSGAYVDATSARMFTRIVGRWTVPAVTAGPSQNPNREYRSSVWIGLDGQGSYRDSSLPQVGTSDRIAPGGAVAQHQAWFEWWQPLARRSAAHALPIYIDLSVLPIQEGDSILCWMDVLPDLPHFAHNAVRVLIKNETRNVFILPFYVYCPKTNPTVTGATANWIVERPSFQNRRRSFLMPKFTNPMPFDCCLAGSSAALDGVADREHGLAVSKRIKLFQPVEGVARTETIATPTLPGGPPSRFEVAVRGS
jgi:hypothetical protein